MTDGIYAKDEVISGIADAVKKIENEKPDRIITIGGNCMVSLAPFDYLHGIYDNVGIVWIDAHPDVSTTDDGYPNAHAMVLGSLMGYGAEPITNMMKNTKFQPNEILYVGLQGLHEYQEKFLNDMGVNYKVQTEEFVSNDEIKAFVKRFDHILVHFDIDVLDEHFFHSTYFANKDLVGDGSSGGKMTVEKLSEVSGVSISCFDDMVEALRKRHEFFAAQGCKLSDHGIEEFYAEDYTDAEIRAIFNKVYGGTPLTHEEILKFKSAMLVVFGEMDYETGWTQQYHYGAIRNNNTKMFKLLGPDTGFDSIGEFNTAKSMSKFLDRLNTEGKLTKTILYNLNPCANEVIATMLGNFQDGTIPGKIQFGSGWWFLDQKDGMEKQMNALSLLGLLSRFVGMLTDSRSFLSYPRHEYFRRTLCNLLGKDVENGEIPASEMPRVQQMVEDISYYNAKNFFQF